MKELIGAGLGSWVVALMEVVRSITACPGRRWGDQRHSP